MSSQAKKLIETLPKHKMIMDPKSYRMAHPVYKMRDIETIEITHKQTLNFRDKFALRFVKTMR